MFLGAAYGSTQCFGSETTATGEIVVHVENRFGFVIVILASCSEVAHSYFFLKHGEVRRVGHEVGGQVGGGVPRKWRQRLSLKARKPWKHEGISRSTWFSRRRKFERYWARLSGGRGVAQRACCSRCDDEHHAIVQAARLDVAQRAWSLRCDDEHHVKDAGLDRDHVLELESWIEWQRRYDAAPL
jgi:hypothetical protein